MHPVLHQVLEIEDRVHRLEKCIFKVMRRLQMTGDPRDRNLRRRMTVQQMAMLESRGVRQIEIAARAGVMTRQVRALLSRVRLGKNGRPLGS
ncbi:MAG: hypothetical protein H0W83_00215 [Planctomycetes bacterium]|nr:hypothetical protein [Planctomycetota bacterium]